MVIRPKLLLMDEPLSNLDAKLRVELRDEIRDIQKTIGIAAIYVTHDQEEALAISDRICVMNAGRIEQIGTPQEIYADPQTLFVATFVGTMNTLPGEAAAHLGLGAERQGSAAGRSWAIRPEHIGIVDGKELPDRITLRGSVLKYTYLGREAHVLVRTAVGHLVVQLANPAPTLSMSEGSAVALAFRRADVLAFDESGARIPGGAT